MKYKFITIMIFWVTVVYSCKSPNEIPFLELSSDELSFLSKGGVKYSTATSGSKVTAQSLLPWCMVSVLNKKTDNLMFTVSENDTEEERTAKVMVTSGDLSRTVTVKQNPGQSSSLEENPVLCVQADPLEKVFRELSYSFEKNSDMAVVAKGETVSFQFVLSSAYPMIGLKVEAGNLTCGNRQIAASMKAFVGYIRAGVHTKTPSKDAIFPDSDFYPDCLQEIESMNVPAGQNQPVWIEYYIPREATAGDYSATLVFTGKLNNGESFEITKKVNARVYPVVLPEQTFWVCNEFSTKGDDNLSKMNSNQAVEPYSERYWDLLTALMHTMRDHGNNVYEIAYDRDWYLLCNIKLNNAQYSFDFTNFDKFVEILIREGNAKRIVGGCFGKTYPGGPAGSPLGVEVPNIGVISINDTRAQNYLSQFCTALYNHLVTKGWAGMYLQRVADEPSDASASDYKVIAGFIKNRMPGIPIIDAVGTTQLTGSINIWIPVLSVYHQNYTFYQGRQTAGDEVWFYTCNVPQGNYANRYLEQPLIQTRFLHWINYRYGATGYLHWGYNYWRSQLSDHAGGWNILPAGDAWIVYPIYGKVYSSIRLKAMRDGIVDYELLKLLEKKAPDKATELSSRIINAFDSYDSNLSVFRQTRRELLEALSE